uniref:Uncharacterized protein n=1 Tax=Hucho hucho TaxID=62062 RepID=A0A4W5KDK6_9TELE
MALKTEDTITYISYFLCLMQVCSMLIPFQLQGQLVGNFPLECLQDDVFMAFPSTAIASMGKSLSSSGAKAIYVTLKNIDTLFGADDLPTKWDQQNSVDTGDYLIRAEGLETYFGNIAAVLKEKVDSCAWEVVRKELLYTLQFILEHSADSLLWPNRT